MSSSSVLVVGAGLAGLVAARALASSGRSVVVVDGGDVGGSLARRHLDGLDLDVGAEGFATRGGAVAELLTELGLDDRVVAPESTGTWVHRPEGSTRIPDGAVLGIPTDLGEGLDALGAGAAARVREDAELPPSVGADAETLGSLVRARMGEAVVRTWLAPLVAGVHRLDVDAIPPGLLLPGVLDRLAERGSLAAALGGGRGGALAGLAGGMTQLADALARELTTLGARLLPVGAVAVEPDARGWRVRTSDGGALSVDRLLLASPPWSWPSGLPAALAEQGRAWPAPRPVDLVTLVVAHDGGGRQAGVIVADGGGTVAARALTYSSAKWEWLREAAGDRVVLRLTYDAREESDEDLAQRALRDAATLTGATWAPADLRAADRTRWLMPRSAVDPGMSEHRTAMRAALDQVGVDATGGWLAGTGLAWTVADARQASERIGGTIDGVNGR